MSDALNELREYLDLKEVLHDLFEKQDFDNIPPISQKMRELEKQLDKYKKLPLL